VPDPGLVAYFEEREPAYAVKLKEVDWAWVYPAPRMMYEASGKTEIEGRAWLLGYSLGNGARAGKRVPVTLYFRVLGDLPPNEAFDVRLVSPDGRLVGEWYDTGRPDGWTPGAIIEWQGTLILPVELLAGDYRLDVGLSSLETGQPLARFSWGEDDEGWLVLIEHD